MSDRGPDSEDLGNELERSLSEAELEELLGNQYHRYQKGDGLLELLDEAEVRAVLNDRDDRGGPPGNTDDASDATDTDPAHGD
jgi:hypothetical protein